MVEGGAMVLGSFADLCVQDVGSSVAFYQSLLRLDVLVDHGWYAELGVGAKTLIAFVQSGHETVPAITATPPRGVLVSFEVDSADAVYANAVAVRCPVLVDLVTELGQRHFMVVDPDGAAIDVIERVALARCRSFSARFPLDVDDTAIPIQVAGHLDERATASTIQPAETQLKVELVGNVGLLPMAYDVVLTAVRERGLQPVGTAVEHYIDLGEVGRTEVAIPVQCSRLT
jgi:predicted enzyme related to lactoylglutathione lyase